MIAFDDLDRVRTVARLIAERGWAEGPEGNLSWRLDRSVDQAPENTAELPVKCPTLSGLLLAVSNSGSRFRDIAEDPASGLSLVAVGPDGSSYAMLPMSGNSETMRAPTSELPTHLLVHEILALERPDRTTLLHVHVNELIAMSMHPDLDGNDGFADALMNVHPEMRAYFPSGIGFVPYLEAGSAAIAEATVALFHSVDLVMWQRHGVLAIGRDIDEAYDRIAIAAKAAALWLLCRASGFAPERSGS